MERFRNYAIASVIALLVFTSTPSALRTSQVEQPQGPTPPTKFFKKKNPIPNRYIVVLKDDVVSDNATLEVRRAGVTAIAKSHAETYGGKFDYVYETALKGYAIVLPDEAAAIAISNLPEVRWVEEDVYAVVDVVPAISKKPPEPVCGGKPVAVSLMGPLIPNYTKVTVPRTSFLNGGIAERKRLVIRDRDQFNEFWKELFRSSSDKPLLPEVDFSREMIVVAAMGQRPSSAYAIIIDSACEVGNQLEVLVRSIDASKCGMQLGVLTAPVDVVRLPKTDLPVIFRETEISDCK